jgi:uncharacterized protein
MVAVRKNLIILVLLLVSSSLFAQENPREFEMKEGDTTYVMKQYFFCIYLKGPNRGQDSATTAELQRGHLAHINAMAAAGVICMAGPMGDDTEKRGILIFDIATMEEAEAWIKKDPMVIAGRLTYEMHPWWCAKGSVLK